MSSQETQHTSAFFDARRESAPAGIGPGGSLLRLIGFEFRLSWRFVRRDLSSTMLPALLFMMAALKTRLPLDALDVVGALLKWAAYFWLYIYTFCLANQITGVEEDRVNKPDRPIPAGMVSLRGAWRRLVISSLVFVALGVWFGVWHWAVLWLAASDLHHFAGLDKNWFSKNNIVMPLGCLAEIGAAWELVAPLSPLAWRWLIVVALTVSLTAALQDFRDVCGDRLNGRRTLPILLGEHRARVLMCLIFLGVCVLLYLTLLADGTLAGLGCAIGLSGLALYICFRLLAYRSSSEDHRTYMVFTYWYCSLVASAIVLV